MTFKAKTILMGVLAFSLMTACSDDDDDNAAAPAGTNNTGGGNNNSNSSISFDGKSYALKGGLVGDFGPYSAGSINNTHYNKDFLVADDNYLQITDTVFNETYYGADNAATVQIYIELFSPDTMSFKTGTFNYISEDSVTTSKVMGQYYFSNGEIELDNDGVVKGDLDGPEFEIVGGSVIVGGSGPSNYNLTFNLTASNGKAITGTYSGSFIYEDFR